MKGHFPEVYIGGSDRVDMGTKNKEEVVDGSSVMKLSLSYYLGVWKRKEKGVKSSKRRTQPK